MAHGPRKKPLDFGGNPDHLTLGLDDVRLRLDGAGPSNAMQRGICFTRLLINSNNFARSAASEVCALPCAILVICLFVFGRISPQDTCTLNVFAGLLYTIR